MAQTKRELLLGGGIANQQALVKKLQTQKALPSRKLKIPGGKNMMDTIKQQDMETAIYNWLRACRAFSEVTISLAKDPDSHQCSVRKVKEFEFDSKNNREIWETHPEGKLYLAGALADVLNTHKAVKVVANKDGIWLHADTTGEFSPITIVSQAQVDAQEQLVQEVKADMIAAGEDPDTLNYTPLQVGDEMSSDAWEPYVEFIPKRKKEYGR